MRLKCWPVLVAVLAIAPQTTAAQPAVPSPESAPVYYPGATWATKPPSEAGVDAARLKEAVDYAVAGETKNTRDLMMNHYQTFGREPFGYAIGPIRERGDPTGIVVRRGYIVAQWGDA